MATSAGCGNPIGLSNGKPGETVLDLGSSGIDCFLAAKRVGEKGHVIGIDMTHAMIDLTRRNALTTLIYPDRDYFRQFTRLTEKPFPQPLFGVTDRRPAVLGLQNH